MKYNKRFIIIITIISCFFFISCTNTKVDPNKEKLEKFEEVKKDIIQGIPLDVNGELTSITLEKERDGVTISYESSDEGVISNDGLINYPSKDEFIDLKVTFRVTLNDGTIHEESKTLLIIVRKKVEDNNNQDENGENNNGSQNENGENNNENQNENGENNNENQPDELDEQKLSEIEMEIYWVFGTAKTNHDIVLPTTSLYNTTVRYETSDERIITSAGVVGEDIDNEQATISFYIIHGEKEYGPYSIVITVNTHVAKNDHEYYSSIDESLYGANLKSALRSLITTTQKKTTTYDEIKTVTVKTDADPEKEGNIILFYSRVSVSGKWDSGKTWNREHVWPRSKSWFEYTGAGSDIHHLRPTNPSINSSRGNKAYSTTTTSSTFGPDDVVKGDIARIVFYLLTRYPESDSYPITNVASSMKMLLEWNELDPVDNLELHRNEECFKLQGNRNPFIDYPEYANMIWRTLDINVHEPMDRYITINYVIMEDIKRRWV